MPAASFAYIDTALERLADAVDAPFWRNFHWGLFPDAGGQVDRQVDDAERYFAAAQALTDHVVARAGVADGSRVLDVGCGFGGTLDHVRTTRRGCRVTGVNIDVRQLQQGRRLLGGAVPFVAADGCALPVAGRSVDHLLAIECLFHFPSRRRFFREAARVLRPGGTLALTDFVMAPGATERVIAALARPVLDGEWFGHVTVPVTPLAYERLGRAVGLDRTVDDDITAATLPTYELLRRLAVTYADRPTVPAAGHPGFAVTDRVEALSAAGDLGYHVLVFERRRG